MFGDVLPQVDQSHDPVCVCVCTCVRACAGCLLAVGAASSEPLPCLLYF